MRLIRLFLPIPSGLLRPVSNIVTASAVSLIGNGRSMFVQRWSIGIRLISVDTVWLMQSTIRSVLFISQKFDGVNMSY